MEALQNNHRTEQAQSNRARLERIEETSKERSHQTRHELQEYRDRRLEVARDPSTVHRNNRADQSNFHRFKDVDQLPTRQRQAVMTYMDNQRRADQDVEGEVLLKHVDCYA